METCEYWHERTRAVSVSWNRSLGLASSDTPRIARVFSDHKLSPFTYALEIAEKGSPLLLIHGDNDNNAGTHPMQVRAAGS